MNYAQIDDNGIYLGMVEGIAGDVPGSWFSPVGVRVSLLGNPPTDEPGAWRDDGAAWVAVVPPTLETAKTAKLAEIVATANMVKAALSSRFSALEESTWPEQEAGACSILTKEDEVSSILARLILQDATATDKAVQVVQGLAAQDKTTPELFAARILANAKLAHDAGLLSLMEQRAMEQATNAATTVAEVEAVEVVFTVIKQTT